MPTDITIQSLLPALRNTHIAQQVNDVSNTTFVGVDFGTSTTVVSVASFDGNTMQISASPIWLNQKLSDGGKMSSEKIPTVIAWYNQQLLVGNGASDLKYQLRQGVNVWYSFKMDLGVDYGAKYYNSELGRDSDFPILNPKDAAKVFFQYLKAKVDRFVREKNLPAHVQYAVSIPASFEANQRKELVYALEHNGIALSKQALIDEPNAAFLSYVQVSSSEGNPLLLPDGDNPKVLVFDFGAGTCDVSILELGRDINGIYSKNLSISKFERLGGDDIDRLIAIEHLFPQLLKESGKSADQFRTPEKKRILTALLKAAERLKIMICESIALQTIDRQLPSLAVSKDHVSIGTPIEIDSRKGKLTLTEPRLSYAEFESLMKRAFIKEETRSHYRSKEIQDEFASIFSPIQTALKKANLAKSEIDYVLFIGGSSKNPYVQAALKNYFEDSDLLVPRDLQTHVSAGAAIHSLIFNGFGKNIIQPITSEPFLVITKDETPRIILRAGTHIPCDLVVIDDLVTSHDGQKAIELPICLGNLNKILYNIKIVSSDQNGFKRNTPVKLELEITADKLLVARASAVGQAVYVEPLNPFANKELSTEERIVLKAERQASLEAEQNGGKPTEQSLRSLYKAYEKVGNDFRAAETLELLNELYPDKNNYNSISVLYANAGHREKALEFAEQAYLHKKNATTAFNYAYDLRHTNQAKFKEILEESLRLDPKKPHSLYELGKLLKKQKDPQGEGMIQEAFEIWKARFEANQMQSSDYGWLASAAEAVGMRDFAQRVREAQPSIESEGWYNSENLTITARQEGLSNI